MISASGAWSASFHEPVGLLHGFTIVTQTPGCPYSNRVNLPDSEGGTSGNRKTSSRDFTRRVPHHLARSPNRPIQPLTTKEAKELNTPPPQQQQNRPQLLAAQNRVFGCLGDAEFDHPFCSNLNGLAGCWISAHASFA